MSALFALYIIRESPKEISRRWLLGVESKWVCFIFNIGHCAEIKIMRVELWPPLLTTSPRQLDNS